MAPSAKAGSTGGSSVVWTGQGANNNFAQDANWASGSAPVAGDKLRFDGTQRLNPKNNLGSTVFDSVTFRRNAGAFTIGGNPLYLSSGITNNSSQVQTFASDVHLGAGATVETVAGATTAFSGTVHVKNGLTFTGEGETVTSGGLADEATPRRKDPIIINSGTVRSPGSWMTASKVAIRNGALIFESVDSSSSIGDLVVGQQNRNKGYLSVRDGASLSSGNAVVGQGNHSEGVVEVTDGARWTAGYYSGSSGLDINIVLGEQGKGTLNILRGGNVLTGAVGVGYPADSTNFAKSYGELLVSGKGSLLDTQLLLLGSGKISVLNGGKIKTEQALFAAPPHGADEEPAVSETLVSGKNSVLQADVLAVAAGSSVMVNDKGKVKAWAAQIQGLFDDAIFTVSGNKSVFNVSGRLGLDGVAGGKGVLQIFDQGTVRVGDNAVMGSFPGVEVPDDVNDYATQALVTNGSMWRVENFLVVGGFDTANLGVDNFSHVDAGNMIIGAGDTGVGYVSVRGTGSDIGFDGETFAVRMEKLTIGQAGQGDLVVEDFGSVVANKIVVGEERGGKGRVMLDGGTSGQPILQAIKKLTIGDEGKGTVVVKNRAELRVRELEEDGAKGKIEIGKKGVLNIGGGEEMGYVDARVVDIAEGGVLRFNHTTLASSAYFQTFDANISGAGQLVHAGPGDTVLTGNGRNFTGETIIRDGRLITTRPNSLGTSAVSLRGGALGVADGLRIGSLEWGKGALEFNVGASFLSIDGAATNLNGHGGSFVFNDGMFFEGGLTYDLITTGSGFLGFDIDDFTGNSLFDLAPLFSFSGDGLTLSVTFIDNNTGNEIDNDGGPRTPVDSDFTVDGSVFTSDGDNTVNSLIFLPGSKLTINDLLTVTSGKLTVTGSATITGDTLSLPNGLTKLGQGLLNLINTVLVNGTAQITEGILAVNGQLAANQVVVDFIAALKGSGLIFGDVVNNGTVAPGNSPGTLTIDGNFTQASSGTLEIEAASLTNFDRLIVSGQAALAGTLSVVSFDGFQFQYGQQFNFLEAGSIVGAFDTITVTNPEVFRGRVLVEGGSASVVIAPTSYTLVAQNQNQRNVAAALDSYISAPSGDRAVVSTALDVQTEAEYGAAFDAISPGFYQSLAQISIEQANAQNQMIAQRLSAVRLGVEGFSIANLDMALANDKDGKSVMEAKDAKNLVTPSTHDPRWALWVQGNGIFGRATSVSSVPNYNYQSGGFLGGGDYRWSESFSTGVYAGYQGTYSKYSGGSSTTINSALFGLYATYQSGGFYMDGIVGGAYNNYNNRRSIEFSTIDRTARSQVEGGQLTAYLDAGYDWKVGKFTFGPVLSGQYTYTGFAPFTESGADSLDLAVGQQNANSIRTNVGGRIAYTWNVTENITIIPEGRLFWQHEYLNGPRNISATLDGGSGAGFGFETSSPGRDSVFAGAGVSANFGERWNTSLYYNADFGRQDFTSHMISGNLTFRF